MNSKEKVLLTKEQETLLIPLYARAQDNLIINDEMARHILDNVQYDFARLKVPYKTVVMVNLRALQLDAYTNEFIEQHPDGLVLHLGCGLDSRCLRVGRRETRWIDLDLPDVIALRRKFYVESDTYHMIASSVTDLTWMNAVENAGSQVLVVAEGLLMYLEEGDVRALIQALHNKFPGCSLIFDAFSKLTVDRVEAHPSLQRTGANVHWGIDDPHEIEAWASEGGIHLKEEWFLSQSPAIEGLSWYYRFMFRLTEPFLMVQRAHRILYYTL